MIQIGRYNTLRIAREAEPGAYLTDGATEVLLPRRFVPPKEAGILDLKVFVYTDSEDRPVATTQVPLATVGEFAYLECVQSTRLGAFMNWGLDKDLLVPFAEQFSPIREHGWAVVRVLLDEKTNRVYGSTRLSRYLGPAPLSIATGHEIEVMAYRVAEHGMLVIVDNAFAGLIFESDGASQLRVGDRKRAFVKRVREDGRVAVTLLKEGFRAALQEAPEILAKLKSSGGYLPYGDRSDPDEIRMVFGMSKAAFKKAIGQLLKQGKIRLEHHGIRLAD